MMADSERGYLFDLSRILNRLDISDNQLQKVSQVSRYQIDKIRAAKEPVDTFIIRKVISALEDISGQEFPFGFPGVFPEVEAPGRDLAVELIKGAANRENVYLAMDYAALALTNPHDWANHGEDYGFRILTSYDIYQYLPLIHSIITSDGPEAEEAFGDMVENLIGRFRDESKRKFEAVARPTEVGVSEKSQPEIAEFLKSFDGQGDYDVRQHLKDLCDRGLVVDPLLEGVGLVLIAVVGILPTSFTKRTEEGDVVYRRIAAMLWDYEHLTENEKVETRFHLRAEIVVKAIKDSVAYLNKHMNESDGL